MEIASNDPSAKPTVVVMRLFEQVLGAPFLLDPARRIEIDFVGKHHRAHDRDAEIAELEQFLVVRPFGTCGTKPPAILPHGGWIATSATANTIIISPSSP